MLTFCCVAVALFVNPVPRANPRHGCLRMKAPNKLELEQLEQKGIDKIVDSADTAFDSLQQSGIDRIVETAAIPKWAAPKKEFKERAIRGQSIPIIGGIRKRRRVRKDAETLIGLASSLEDPETLYLSKEMSLSSTATDLWSELKGALDNKGAGSALEQATREAGAAIAELGRAAQASLSGRDAPKTTLSAAGARAKVAVEQIESLASKVADATNEVKGKSQTSSRLNNAWRRDAIRAIGTLERAPEMLQREVRRQRLAKLNRETPHLRLLGLDRKRLETITVADLKAARVARAKAFHPDVLTGANARGDEGAAGGGLFGAVSRFFGGRDESQRLAARYRSEVGSSDDGEEDDPMERINDAYDAVYKALTASVYDFGI